MLLRRFYDDDLAQASFLIGCQATGDAIVVDPHRDSDVYVEAAEREGMVIRYVTETHIHADFLSGSRQLARRAGATLLLSGDGDEDWQYGFAELEGARIVHDGDEIELGNITLRVLHTPGHTPEHVSFMITDGAASTEPMGVLTGDFLFVGDVGRPDLLEKAAGIANTMDAGARVLYGSLQRFRQLPDYLQILPGHGAGSACGKALGSVPTTTLGYEKLVNWAFQCENEDQFVARVLEDQPEPPAYFAHMKRMNRDGPPLLDRLPEPPLMGVDTLAARVQDGIVVDVRRRDAFAEGHVPGTLSIPHGGDFTNWAGSLLPYDRPIHLIAGDAEQARGVARDMAMIGLDRVEGYWPVSALDVWSRTRGALQTTPVVDWVQAERALRDEGAQLLDVRRQTEWNEGHVALATHVHLGNLRSRLDELPEDRPILVYCRTGQRSAIGAALLQAEGFADVRNVEGGFSDRIRRGLPTEGAAVLTAS